MASVLLVQPVERTWDGPRSFRAMDSSLERLPCVPAMMEKREAVPPVKISAALFFDEDQAPAAGAQADADLRWRSVGSGAASIHHDAGLRDRFAGRRAATVEPCVARGEVRLVPSRLSGSKFGVDRRRYVLMAGVSIPSTLRMPLLPSRSEAAKASRPMPLGLTTPRPVITTFRRC